MKALKSNLAKKVLADPRAREQLRGAAAGELRGNDGSAEHRVIILRDSQGRVDRRLTATAVPKAA